MGQSVLDQSPQQMLPGSKQTPGFAGTPFDFKMPTHQKKIRHQAETDRTLDTASILRDLVLPNSQATFKLFKENFNHPTSLVNQQDVTCRQRFREIGHEDTRGFEAGVAPQFCKNHRDFTQMFEDVAFFADVEETPFSRVCESRNPCFFELGFLELAQMGFDVLAVGQIPGFGTGKHVEPAQFLQQLKGLNGCKGRVCQHNLSLNPFWPGDLRQDLTYQDIVFDIQGVRFGPDQAEGNGDPPGICLATEASV